MSQFINARQDVVTEAIDGLLRTGEGRIARLDGYPHIKVVVRTDWDRSKVAVISGGGSGHEPFCASFVGEGMLTAAVCGDIFASPSADAVLASILAVTGGAGCLLVVTNYTGDRLNFGLAAARARAIGLKVSMVFVKDDVALPDLPQPRGVAGTVLVQKIASAHAARGEDLDAVTTAAQRTADGLASIGMSLSTCMLPGSPREDRIAAGKAELGLGVHGEAGAEQVDFEGARQAMSMVIDRLLPHVAPGPHVALLNNLGGATGLEMSILAEELCRSKLADRITHLVGPAAIMTSLDMRGFSLSVLPVDDADLAAVEAPIAPPAWPAVRPIGAIEMLPLHGDLTPARPDPSPHPERAAFLKKCCELLIAQEETLNSLDAKSGDGDTGSTLTGAASALVAALDRMPLANLTDLYRAIGMELSQTMGGSSGVLLAIFFSAAGDASENGDNVIEVLSSGMERMQQVGGARLGDRTMIDALAPALKALPKGLTEAAEAARKGADHTATITQAKAGRAAYVSASNLIGYNDPGAEAVARLFEGLTA